MRRGAHPRGRGVIAAVGGARVEARVVDAWILWEVDLVARVVHVTRAAEASRAHDGAVDAGRLDAKGRIVDVIAAGRLDVRAVPGLRAVLVLGAVALVAVERQHATRRQQHHQQRDAAHHQQR